MQNKALIIGAGVAGLSAGTYLQMNGFDTEIFELSENPGGVCTSWKRGDYTVDLCIHWLVGSGPSSGFYEKWNELIDLSEFRIVDHEVYGRVEDVGGNQITIYTDLDRLRAEFLNKAPEDAEKIEEFIHACKRFAEMDMPVESMTTADFWTRMKGFWKMLPYMGAFGKYSRISCADYSKEFNNPLLRKAIANLFAPEIPILFCMLTLVWMHKKEAGYPIGGSLNFARRIAERYEELGGKFHYGSRVEKILVENGHAQGIQLANGETHYGDYVISAADGYSTLFNMLDGKYITPELRKYYDHGLTFPSLVLVALGVGRTFDDAPPSLLFELKEPLVIDPDTETGKLYMRIHNFDPTLAPEGKTLLTVLIETRNYSYWQELQGKYPDLYQKEKQRIADACIQALEEKFGNVRALVEMTDVSTPATLIGFTNNWQGSFEGWLITPESGFDPLPHTLPGLDHFYMCGHWVGVGGGLPTVLMSGREVAQGICRKEGVGFEVLEGVER